jgi:hypothetical protein
VPNCGTRTWACVRGRPYVVLDVLNALDPFYKCGSASAGRRHS